MKFKSLKIGNFLTIGAADLCLDDKGLVLIRGINEDDTSGSSNGAGKSSIADALCWALFGQTARGESGDAVVNLTAKKNCFAQVTFADGATGYRITRYRKDEEKKNQTVVEMATGEGSLFEDVSKATERDTQDFIEKILGCSYDVFMASIYAGQEQMPDIPALTPKALKALIEEAAGIKRIEAAYKIARERRLKAANEQGAAMTRSDSAIALKQREEANLVVAKQRRDEFEAGRKGRYDSQMAMINEGKARLIAAIRALKEIDLDGMKSRVSEIDAAIESMQEMIDKGASMRAALSALESKVAVADRDYSAHMATIRAIRKSIENAPEEMKKPCIECGKPHTDDELAEFVAHQKVKLESAAGPAREAQTLIAELEAQIKKAGDEYRAHSEAMPDVSKLNRERSELQAKIKQVENQKAEITRTADRWKLEEENAAKILTEVNPHTSLVEATAEAFNRALNGVATAQEGLQAANDAFTLADNVSKVFGPTGVGAHILDTVTPFLNERTSDYLSALSDGNIVAVWTTLARSKGGDLKEKFTIEVENDKGAKSFKGLSGGEKRKVRIACMLALQDLVSSRATKPIDLFIGDEIDDALDGAGLERLMGVLERKARERGTALIISHAELRDWIDEQVTVTKKGGFSTVEGVLCA